MKTLSTLKEKLATSAPSRIFAVDVLARLPIAVPPSPSTAANSNCNNAATTEVIALIFLLIKALSNIHPWIKNFLNKSIDSKNVAAKRWQVGNRKGGTNNEGVRVWR